MDDRGALFDLTVIEIGTEIAAPYAGRLLAELGATVIKAEPPGGDPGRWLGPFPGDRPDHAPGPLFRHLNAGKHLLTLDLEDPTGRRELDRLLDASDILIDNRPPAETRRLGLDHASLAQPHPHLITAYITIFGQTGPYADYAAHDLTACAASGVCAGIGIPGRPPLTMPFQQGQYQGGLAAASGALAAWLARERIGRGQLVDIAISEVWSDFFGGMHAPEMIFRGVLGLQMGWRSGLGRYPQTILPCQDGYVSLSAPQKAQWLRFVDLIGRPAWTENPRYRDRRAMGQEYPDEVDALLAGWLTQHTKEEIFTICRERRIPFAPVRTVDDLVVDPQLAHRGFFAPLDLGDGRVVKVPTGPYAFSETPVRRSEFRGPGSEFRVPSSGAVGAVGAEGASSGRGAHGDEVRPHPTPLPGGEGIDSCLDDSRLGPRHPAPETRNSELGTR
ncbi:MAG TPA: CoA transferase, partial [Dehalococcoidia bacterium]|nr:CoA transferase [Dehalococcoidia bacterium]